MPELLLELFSEEIPARMQRRAAADLERLVTAGLKDAGLEFKSARSFSTPRRLTLVIDGLPETQPDIKDERKGPQVGAPEKAIEGFKKSLPDGAVIEEREIKGKTFYFAVIDMKGGFTGNILNVLLGDIVWNFPWPKSMRWADKKRRWVRPLHRIVALFNGHKLLDPLAGYEVGNISSGHRFMAPDPFTVKNFDDYAAKLRDAKVILDPAERREKIRSDADALAKAEGLTVKSDDALLDEVTGLVEWPVVLMGRFDDDFLSLPPEVLIAAMRGHQKYFSLIDGNGKLASRFIVVANIDAPDGGAAIRAGNERVLHARLSDAKFFWDQDCKTTLASLAPRLKDIVFHAKLGTVDEKVDRMQATAAALANFIPGADKDRVRSAARLAKADLVCGMVTEFPELQGIMGSYYARHDGEHDEVANAIGDHYSPLGPSDHCPTAPVSVAVALADKIDTLAGFWAIDEKPTGSKDPFALRRAALGVIRLIVENRVRVALGELIATALNAYSKNPAFKRTHDEVKKDLLAFFADRLAVHLKNQDTRHDHIAAVFSQGEDDLVRLLARVAALKEFLATEDGANLLVAYKRATNIIRIEEKKDKRDYSDAEPDVSLLSAPEEKNLFAALSDVRKSVAVPLSDEDYTAAMGMLSALRSPLDAFFDAVMVNSDDAPIRENRLRLLWLIRSTLESIADFSKIEG